jgi:hypothetical protein
MVLTTPPRPVNLLKALPELGPYGKPAVRLHPREGRPVVDQSSVAGPLLWPVEEPWPHCTLMHDPIGEAPADASIRLRLAREGLLPLRVILEGQTETERAERERTLAIVRGSHPRFDPGDPVPLIPVAQLYYCDVPGLPWADRYDLLQILWCPLQHPEETGAITPYCPAFEVRWRRTATIDTVPATPPTPVMLVEEYLPNTCTVEPEPITEYPNFWDLPDRLRAAVVDWEDRTGSNYSSDFALAPGWKATGYGGAWSLFDPYPIICECGTEQQPLFTATTGEYDAGTQSWRPLEEAATGSRLSDPVGVHLGRSNTLQLYYCPASEHHQGMTEMF